VLARLPEATLKHKLTPAFVANLPVPSRDRDFYWEGNSGLMVTARGHKAFVIQYRAGRLSRRMSLGGPEPSGSLQRAKKILGDFAKGADPLWRQAQGCGRLHDLRRTARSLMSRAGVAPNIAERCLAHTIRGVYDRYAYHHTQGRLRGIFARALGKLRTAKARKDVVECFPLWAPAKSIPSALRDRAALDGIEAENRPHQAQAVLSFLSKIFIWHASRDADFLSPIRRGMGRTKLGEYARDRVLSDDEIRGVWRRLR
jgi:hypothetical protein